MIVLECPHCHSTFQLDETLITRDRIKLRCSVCEHVFVHEREVPASADDPFADLLSAADESSTLTDEPAEQEDLTEEQLSPETAEVPSADEAQPESVIREIDSILGAGEEIAVQETVEETEGTPERRRSRIRILVGIILMLAILAGAAWYFRDLLPFGPQAQPQEEVTLERGPFFQISDQSVTYEIINNHREGTTLVLRGIIEKLSQKPVRSVLVQARVYDEEGELIQAGTTYAGIMPEATEFTRQPADIIDGLLNAEPQSMGILADSRELPFALAFFGTAARKGTSFQVEVKEFHWQ